MSNLEIVRAWKDPEYRKMLNEAPPLPVGTIELEDPYLTEKMQAQGGFASMRGEHTTVTACNHCNLTHSCPTHLHCPHTGWQCGAVELRSGTEG